MLGDGAFGLMSPLLLHTHPSPCSIRPPGGQIPGLIRLWVRSRDHAERTRRALLLVDDMSSRDTTSREVAGRHDIP
jgi:hypothetical protein